MGGDGLSAIWKATAAAKAGMDRPTLIRFKAIIGYGPPSTANSLDAHGLPDIVHYTRCIMGDGCLGAIWKATAAI